MKKQIFNGLILTFLLILFGCKKSDDPSPTITTMIPTTITQITAISGGVVSSDGGSTVTVRGVCWSTNNAPTINDNKTIDGAGIGSFVSSMTSLTAGTVYYVRAYATNASGVGYGMTASFTTNPPSTPTLTTAGVTGITQTSATCEVKLISDGAATIISQGVCWSNTSINPTIADNKILVEKNGTQTFTCVLNNLTGNTNYYVRAYALNSVGTSYGNQISFKTSPILPIISTTPVSSITITSYTSGGNISNDGGSPVISRGICWNTITNPIIATNSKTIDGTGSGIFASNLIGLNTNTIYYARAYATNSVGTSYGNEISFQTPPPIMPTLVTTFTYSTSTSTAMSGGNITDDGSASIIARGVCWNTVTQPTITNNRTIDGIGKGIFTSSITGLTANTNYYARAYATNSVGTSYGNEVNFVTLSLGVPTIGLVAYYPFNGNTNDNSGSGNNGIINGATLTLDRFGNQNNAYSFNGINNYIEIPNSSNLNFGISSLTVSVWVKLNNYQQSIIFGKEKNTAPDGYQFRIEANAPISGTIGYAEGVFNNGMPRWLATTNTLTLNTWYNIIIIKNGTLYQLYLNGQLNDNLQSITLLDQSSNLNNIILGAESAAAGTDKLEFFNGNLDDVRLYNRVLSNGEIQQLYHEGGW
jgi:hypothetical protein